MRIAIVVVLLLLMSSLAFAQARFIRCPIQQARTEMVTPLPAGWWQTPQVGNLTGTRIETIGGHQTLVCLYRAYDTNVSVMLRQPPRTRCTPQRGGFACAPIP